VQEPCQSTRHQSQRSPVETLANLTYWQYLRDTVPTAHSADGLSELREFRLPWRGRQTVKRQRWKITKDKPNSTLLYTAHG